MGVFLLYESKDIKALSFVTVYIYILYIHTDSSKHIISQQLGHVQNNYAIAMVGVKNM